MRGFMFDGNFTAEQLKMKNPEDDVHLTDGDAFFTTRKPYYDHLKVAKEIREVCLSHLSFKICHEMSLFSKERAMTIPPSTKPICLSSIYCTWESGLRHVLDTAASFLIRL
jgi:hypothetical protein